MKQVSLVSLAMVVAVSSFAAPIIKNGEKIAFLGDSITQFGNQNDGGYVNLVMRGLKKNGVNAEKIPAGVSGNKSDQMLARLQKDVLDKKPEWMTLSCGVNDVGHGKNGIELEPYKKNITAILDRCAASGVKVIVLTPTLCSDADWRNNANNKKLDGYCAFLRKTAAERKLPLADLNTMEKDLLASPKAPKSGLTMDGLHMNGYGNQMMALGVLKAMGLTDEQLADCKKDWDVHVKAMLPLGTHWGNWNASWKQLTVNMWETLETRAGEKGFKKTYDYIYSKINDRAPDLDWRKSRFETLAPRFETAPDAGFRGRIAALDRIDAKNAAGDDSKKTWKVTAWKNERVNGQIVLWTKEPVEQVRVRTAALKGTKDEIPASAMSARFVRYTTASFSNGNEVGSRTGITGDILDDATSLSMTTDSFRPVWLTVKVPAKTAAGDYKGEVEVIAAGAKKLLFPIELTVLDRMLPPPKEWKFFLDLWQHPWAVARYHGVKPFSKEHYALMKPLWEELAEAGQKVITTTITELPWNQQNFDAYRSMVRHIKLKDGTFKRDFSLWDEYVAFCEKCGLGPQIHCYTMATWGHIVYWEEEETGDIVKAALKPGTPEHEAFWGPFLAEFHEHLKVRGRLGRVYIALDERSRDELYATAELIRKRAPKLKLELAGNAKPSEFEGITIDNYCQYIHHITPAYLDEVRKTRSSDRFTSTFYVCCGPQRPNTFSDSPLAESQWIGLYAAATRLDGFLRWAYVNWGHDPIADSSFGNWRPGDTFLVYPGPRLSSRWEMLRDGIEDCEKIRILRSTGKATPRIEKALSAIDYRRALGENDSALAANVAEVVDAVMEASAK